MQQEVEARPCQVRNQPEVMVRQEGSSSVQLASCVRTKCPPLPPGVQLARYAPKSPPVAIQPCGIVTDVGQFIHAYLRDMEWRLQHPKAHACVPLAEILAKLAGVGLELAVDAELGESDQENERASQENPAGEEEQRA